MTSVALVEHGTAIPVDLNFDERTQLEVASRGWKGALGLAQAPLVFESDGPQLRMAARNVAGSLRVGNTTVEIAPKFLEQSGETAGDWRAAFWNILVVVQRRRAVFGSTDGSEAERPSIADLIAEIFVDSFSRGSVRGLPLAYRELTTRSVSPRGSFDSRRAAEWLAEPWLVPTIESELDLDGRVAHLLRWAAIQLRPVVSSSQRARDLTLISQSLPKTMGRPSLAVAERIELSPQHQALRPAIDVAILLLKGRGIHNGGGEQDVIGFLWKSEDVYEQFIFWLCRRAAFPRGYRVVKRATQFGVSLTAPPLITTPDVVFLDEHDIVRAVIDAKYKSINTTPKSADSYQVLAAANHLGCTNVGLVYPSSAERSETRWSVKSRLGAEQVTISTIHLNLLQAASRDGMDLLQSQISDWLNNLHPQTSGAHLETPSS